MQEVICSLIIQCLINEYIWYVSDEEKRKINEKYAIIKESENVEQIPWVTVAQLAMYSRMSKFIPTNPSVRETIVKFNNAPQCFRKFVDEYFEAQNEEMAIKVSIKRFGSINDPTSNIIANNYEEYPYPRWVSLESSSPDVSKNKLLEIFDENDLAFMDKPFHVLVAGCGTGYGAVEYALSYGSQAQILAIDLSMASLAYSTRMARKYKANNVTFMQMDLLDLSQLDQQFDIVECTDVLHHMNDPAEGGKALVSRVREGGIVHISLYSELARREIVNLRQKYNLDPSMSNDQVREYKDRIMRDDADIIEDDRSSLRADFFDLNRCRDLLFHPLKHRFTVPKIGQLLDDSGLEFMGFELPKIIRTQYLTHYPPVTQRRKLSRWDEFEHKNPDAFGSLYQIWLKKIRH